LLYLRFYFFFGLSELLLLCLELLIKPLLLLLQFDVLVLEFFDPSFQIIKMDLHFMFEPDVATNVTFQLLKHLFVLLGRILDACLDLTSSGFVIFKNIAFLTFLAVLSAGQRLFHTGMHETG